MRGPESVNSTWINGQEPPHPRYCLDRERRQPIADLASELKNRIAAAGCSNPGHMSLARAVLTTACGVPSGQKTSQTRRGRDSSLHSLPPLPGSSWPIQGRCTTWRGSFAAHTPLGGGDCARRARALSRHVGTFGVAASALCCLAARRTCWPSGAGRGGHRCARSRPPPCVSALPGGATGARAPCMRRIATRTPCAQWPRQQTHGLPPPHLSYYTPPALPHLG